MKNLTKKIIFLNILIFISWQILNYSFMAENFLVSSDNLLKGRIWTLLTSIFSHHIFFHLFLNMFILYNFGNFLESFLGKLKFFTLYILGGTSGSLFHCLTSSFILNNSNLNALGASGAISGLLIFYSLNFPKKLLYLFGFIPIPALMASLLFISLDLFGLLNQAQGHGLPIGHGAHLGGAVFGGIYFGYLKLRAD